VTDDSDLIRPLWRQNRMFKIHKQQHRMDEKFISFKMVRRSWHSFCINGFQDPNSGRQARTKSSKK